MYFASSYTRWKSHFARPKLTFHDRTYKFHVNEERVPWSLHVHVSLTCENRLTFDWRPLFWRCDIITSFEYETGVPMAFSDRFFKYRSYLNWHGLGDFRSQHIVFFYLLSNFIRSDIIHKTKF